MDKGKALYHRLPYLLRVAAASAHGLRLRRWRYGPETERLVEEALERDTWSAERWRNWQEERLAYILHRAATAVPYYREQWAARRRSGDKASWEVLEYWPVLTKETLRQQPEAVLADDVNSSRMYHLSTSGTTGTPLQLWWSRDTVRAWYALYEARIRRWNGVSRHDRWAIIGGQLVTPFAQTRPPYWVWNAGLRQLYLSAYHIAPDTAAAYLEALRHHEVRYLLGYPSAMEALAAAARERGLEAPKLAVVLGNAEPFYPHQRRLLEDVFGCPTRDTYGMTEIVAGASEDAAGFLRLWPEAGHVEVWADEADEPAKPGESGRLICTGLFNPDMPLIRYAVGDRGRLGPQDFALREGRTLPVLAEVEGRLDDVVLTPDGRRIGRLDPAFKVDLPIRELQIVQDTLETLQVHVVPAPGYDAASHAPVIRRALSERVGAMGITVTEVGAIPRTKNGKVRAVVSMIDKEPATAVPSLS